MKHFISIFSSLTLFVFFSFSLFAQEKEVTLEEVVVTATRDIQEIRKVPANVTVITREEIRQSNSQTAVDLIRDEVGVVVRDYYGNGKQASVDMRGFGETGPLNTLVLVDGRRVNEIDLSGVDWTQIPIDQVERIEIVRGPGSVLYGDNAVGGVINIITKRPEKTFSWNGEGAIGSNSYNKEAASVSGKWGPISAILSANHHSTNGYRENGFLRAKDVGGKFILDLNENISFNLSGGFHQDDTGLPGHLYQEDIQKLGRRATLHPDDEAEADDGYGSLGIKAKFWDLGQIEADCSYRNRKVDDSFPSFSFRDKRNLITWGVTPRYILEKSLGKFVNKLTLGFDFYRSDSNVDSVSSLGPNRSEVTKGSAALYALDEFSILKDLILSLGYRQEWVSYDIYQKEPFLRDEVKDHQPAWNVGLDYLFSKNSSAFLSMKRSFRFAVSDELVQYVFIPPNFVARVNPSMKPQTGYHFETGVRHGFTDQIEANLTFFWIETKDEIFYNVETSSNENFPKTRRQGIEIGAKVKPFQWLSAWGNYSYIHPILRGEPFSGNDIPGVPRHKGSLGVDIDFGKGFLFNTKANMMGARYFISDWRNKIGGLDGYYTLDAKLSYSWKGLKAFVGMNNITNQKYAEYGVLDFFGRPGYYPSPERNFLGGISYTF
jgi:iron complex outermembrane receptor protein